MSDTDITPAAVVAVLLADGWHRIVSGSFSVGALGFGGEAGRGVLGFRFCEADATSPYRRPTAVAGPLDSILAVRLVTTAARYPAAGDGCIHLVPEARGVTGAVSRVR